MVNFKNLHILTSDNVYKPAEDSFLAATVLGELIESMNKKKLKVLDMGTGTGILGLHAATKESVSEVVLADINPDAVAIATHNMEINASFLMAKCSVIETDMFSKVDGKFDIISFNAPYLPHEAADKDMLSKAWDGGENGIEVAAKFLASVGNYLNEEGFVVLVMSSLSDLDALSDAIEKSDLKTIRKEKAHFFFEDIIVYILGRK